MAAYVFSCSVSPSINGYTLKLPKKNPDGSYPQALGVVGEYPTRGGVIYDPPSLVESMNDPNSRFNICLKDGNLCGEYGHPVVEKKEDMPRLFRIDEHYKSHYFTKIWLGDVITINSIPLQIIYGNVVPTGPYADILRRELEDEHHNTSWSIRSLCLPLGQVNGYERRKVQVLVTFDAVHAPGYDLTSKRYSVAGNESYTLPLTKEDIVTAAQPVPGLESMSMLTDADVMKLFPASDITIDGNTVAKGIVNERMFIGTDGNVRDAASLMY